MTFQLIGDEIVFDGKTVAKLLPTINATDRMNVEETLRVWKSEDEQADEIANAIEEREKELKLNLETCIDGLKEIFS